MGSLSCFALCLALLLTLCLEESQANGAKQPTFPLPPDTRPPGCKEQQVEDPAGRDFEDLKASIIIPYRKEKLEHIRGSLDSILYYTPRKYIREIIFVSDGNGRDTVYLNEIREMAPKLITVQVFPHVGLIEAKMRAVAGVSTNATVLLFLEPHVRVNRQWIQPLLRRIREYPKALAMPMLDLIPWDNFDGYTPGANGLWRFEWNFNLAYTNPGRISDDRLEPYPSPATSGGIFAIRRDWWNKLEFYDTGMVGWGGDHVEATMKVWRCGGHIDVVPCSRIGHLFRDAENRPYMVDVPQVVRNYARLANVWLDDYLDHFYKVKSDALEMDIGDVSGQRDLRERLQCEDMSWYLEHVDQEMNFEKDHVCIPNCDHKVESQCCERGSVPRRSAVDRIIPEESYREPSFRSEASEHARSEL